MPQTLVQTPDSRSGIQVWTPGLSRLKVQTLGLDPSFRSPVQTPGLQVQTPGPKVWTSGLQVWTPGSRFRLQVWTTQSGLQASGSESMHQVHTLGSKYRALAPGLHVLTPVLNPTSGPRIWTPHLDPASGPRIWTVSHHQVWT